MRLLLLLPLFLFYCADGFGQQTGDIQPRLRADSLLRSPEEKLDSVHGAFYQKADVLKGIHKVRLASIDSSQQKVQHSIDSLNQLGLPTERYTNKLDSLQQERIKTVSSLNSKMEELKTLTKSRINALGLPPEMDGKVTEVTGKIDGFQLPAKDLNIPELNLPDSPLKNLDGLHSSVPSPFGEVGNIDRINLPGMEGLKNAVEIPGLDKLDEISELTSEVGAYGDDIKQIAGGGNIGDATKISGALEEKAAAAAGVGNLPNADNALEEMTKTPVPLDPAGAKEQAVQQVQQVAVNHFAGKEQVLQQAMEKMAKLKQKYSSLNSLSDIPKKRPNEMRGKPLIERILPGVALQFSGKGNEIFMDVNPYAGYRFNGKFTAGLGWNQRVTFNTKHYRFNSYATVFGPRSFAEYKLGKGFSPRAEFEIMNTLIPATVLKINSEVKYFQWVPGAFIGIKKDYRFYKNVKGTGMIMFRLFNPDHKSPYADVVNVRVGFEFPMKKKTRKPANTDASKSGDPLKE